MTYKVQILKSAQAQIVQQTRYVKEKFGVATARQSYDAINKKLAGLETSPRSKGIRVDDLEDLGIMNYRILIHESHTKALYEIDDSNQLVTVHMVYGSAQDFQTLLYNRIIRYM